MKFSTPLANELVVALRQTLTGTRVKRMSRSEGDLTSNNEDICEVRRSSWYSGPSEVSLDDTDLLISKECQESVGTDYGYDDDQKKHRCIRSLAAFDDSVWGRRSGVSLLSAGSGVYEEIAEEAGPCGPQGAGPCAALEHTYESVECVYGTMRRAGGRHAPPLPPRTFGTLKLGQSWNSRANYQSSEPTQTSGVSRHSSLGSLHCSKGPKHKQGFSVFRKRLKSDSRISSPKCETKETKDVETKKKRFDFTPTRDIFKSFKVSKKMKGLKIGLTKNETKSCEFLDDTRHVTANRCSKSVECIDNEFDLSTDISIQINETNMSALALPEEIVELILNNEQFTKVRLKETSPPLTIESDYMPMSPIASVPPIVPPIEQHYTVMSPRGHTA
ncbi:uncharacterized protein LOC126977977 [Leptidea sinapis]|uniref:uncharacterized protein LOC126977977 n=1 Tax=Leptidea sinapis TaxID=189913 RepID=UPI0021C3D188|nr:uncharacterized protein LOC126977977 [Leptidea sinapis]